MLEKLTCIMMIRPGYQNADILTAVGPCPVNTLKVIRGDMNSRNEDYRAETNRKG